MHTAEHGQPAGIHPGPDGAGLALMTEGPDERSYPCQEHPADLWFSELPEEVEAAKALCLECPVRAACLAGALDRCEPWGVWGGQLVLQGVVVPRKRPRGRPRKDTEQVA